MLSYEYSFEIKAINKRIAMVSYIALIDTVIILETLAIVNRFFKERR